MTLIHSLYQEKVSFLCTIFSALPLPSNQKWGHIKVHEWWEKRKSGLTCEAVSATTISTKPPTQSPSEYAYISFYHSLISCNRVKWNLSEGDRGNEWGMVKVDYTCFHLEISGDSPTHYVPALRRIYKYNPLPTNSFWHMAIIIFLNSGKPTPWSWRIMQKGVSQLFSFYT
jgi:hypothetical protein